MSNVTVDQVRDEISHHRGWFIFLGLLLMVAGAAAIAFPLLGTLAVAVWTAIAFAIAGVAQTVHAFAARSWGGFLFDLLIGLRARIPQPAWCSGSIPSEARSRLR